MRTGNAFFALTLRAPGQPEVRLSLLDASGDAVAEIAIPDLPWEESAAVPLESMSAFRTSVEDLPEVWPPSSGSGEALLVEAQIELDGRKVAFTGHYAGPADVPAPQRRLFAAIAQACGAALVGGRSLRALDLLARFGG